MFNFLNRPLPELARNFAIVLVAGAVLTLRVIAIWFNATTPRVATQYPGEDPGKSYRTYRVNVTCSDYHGPSEAAAIKAGMTYDQLSAAIQTKITRHAEKRVQREEDAKIWYKNPDRSALEIELHSNHVVFAKFLTQEEAAYAEAHPTPTPVGPNSQ